MKRLFVLFVLLVVMIGAVTGSTTATAMGKEVVFGDQTWDSIQFLHRVMGYILEHGYGFRPVYNFSESMPSLIGLERGDNHIVLEVWVEARQEWWDNARSAGKVSGFGKVFPDSPSGLYVPAYPIGALSPSPRTLYRSSICPGTSTFSPTPKTRAREGSITPSRVGLPVRGMKKNSPGIGWMTSP